MKLPRDISGLGLIKLLEKFGYQITRQVGSHIRVTSYENGVHHLTIPNHNPLKIGTFSSILQEVASHQGISKAELVKQIFG